VLAVSAHEHGAAGSEARERRAGLTAGAHDWEVVTGAADSLDSLDSLDELDSPLLLDRLLEDSEVPEDDAVVPVASVDAADVPFVLVDNAGSCPEASWT
jgi:hypothetical protein